MNFNYFMPTKIYFGEDVISKNKNLFKDFGKKAYVITGKHSSKENGSYNDVINSLELLKIQYIVFDEVEENPSLETIERAAEYGKKEEVDFIIGIGGGSPLDASKAIGFLINNKEFNKDNIFTAPNLKSIPVIAVPTTAGTGSEVTQYSIVTDHKEKTKRNLGQTIFPQVALVDPKYMMNMPYDITVNTAIDALSHLIEGYLNTNANVLSDMYAEKGLELFGKCLNGLITNNINYEVREKLMLSSNIAGILISQAGTSIPHGMGYSLTYFKGVPHGKANGMLLAEYMRMFKNKDKVNKVLNLINIESLDKLDEILKKLIKFDVNISENEIKDYTNAMVSNKAKLKNHPEEVQFDDIYNIYIKSLINK